MAIRYIILKMTYSFKMTKTFICFITQKIACSVKFDVPFIVLPRSVAETTRSNRLFPMV